jgi:hypothetical protein
MRKAQLLLFILVTISGRASLGQSTGKFTMSGTVKDKSNGETLPGASVTVIELPGVGALTNSYGFFSLTLPGGKYTIITSYTGFRADTLKVILNKNIVHDVSLSGSENQLQEVTVKAPAKNSDILSSAAGVQTLNIEEIKNVPVLFPATAGDRFGG